MATIYPERFPDRPGADAAHAAEKKVYDALARHLGGDYTVYHGVAWLSRPRGGTPVDGEADFVVAHPRQGVLLVEVKGGGVERDAHKGTWSSVDRAGSRHAISDPFAQAAASKHALLSKVKGLPGWRDRWIDAGHAVFFPDLRRAPGAFGIDASPEIMGFRDDLEHAGYWVDGAMKFWRAELDTRRRLGADGVEALTGLLARSFSLHSPLAVELEDEEREILELTKQQFEILDQLSSNRRLRVCGGAGTGKTVLALEKAQRLAREGFKTLLTCFNKPLAEHLRSQSLACPKLSVFNFHHLCDILAKKAGIPVRDESGPKPPPKYFDETLPGHFLEAIEKLPGEKFDAIVVDEGQDFKEDWWTALQLALKDPDHGILYVFHDDNQRIYHRATTFPELGATLALTKNLRNTRQIHAAAARFYNGVLTAAGPRGRAVHAIEADGAGEAREAVARTARRLVERDEVAPCDIAILSGHNREHSNVLDEKKKLIGDLAVTYDCLDRNAKKPLFDSVHRFKGLERKVVILAELDHVPHLPRGEELLYVALSRARNELFVIGGKAILQSIHG